MKHGNKQTEIINKQKYIVAKLNHSTGTGRGILMLSVAFVCACVLAAVYCVALRPGCNL